MNTIEENFEIVTSADISTGKITTKSNAHSRGILHRISAVHVFTPDLIYVYVQRHKTHNRLFDHSVGGHVDVGETYFQAAEREMFEEVNLSTKLQVITTGIGANAPVINIGLQNIKHLYGVFTTIAPKDWKFVPNEEVDELDLVKVSELIVDMNKNPEKYLTGFLISFDAYLKSINSAKRIIYKGKNWGDL